MQGSYRHDDACRVCGKEDLADIVSFGALPLANGFIAPGARDEEEETYPLDVAVCRNCWLVTLRQVVDPARLFRHYVYVSSESDQIRDHMRRIVDLGTRQADLAPGDLVVELGSNVGTQLGLFQEAGFRVVGVDPAANLVEKANERGVESIADFFGPEPASRIAERHGRASLVLGRQCFAHIDDVHRVLDGVEEVLAPGGALVIEVPYLLDLLDENQFDTIYHEHLSYFSVTTLRHLFALHGLRLVDVERAPVHGGSIVVTAVREGTGREPAPSVTGLLDLERESGLTDEARYRRFAAQVERVTGRVRDLVQELAAQGARVAGYGAPSKGTQLLMVCGIGERELEFCSDTTSLKHGKLLPGSKVPVCSPEEARERRPDYYLLLAWNYAEEIIRKERAFLEQGGRFIVPIPEPRIVSAQSVKEPI
ncbi:class I SAM-dependent methyltransferase [Streptomyces desertarenae]|uniref:Class I SAM-dependent methyltransferase n=1 Tax=Streptomyces desertarenae TaxID=2666184 RepID=A0ABW4PPU6_9ACTN